MSVSFLGAQAVESGVITSSRSRIPVSSASANTKGAYATANIAATAYPASWVLIDLPRAGAATDYLVDVAVGAGGSEQVIIANLPVSQNVTTSPSAASYLFPLYIPAGSRISARAQAATGSSAIDVQVTLFAPMFGGERGLGQVEACGAITATSLGTSVDPGGTTNTKGTPAELIAATSFAYKWVCLSVNHTNVVGTVKNFAVDIMVGAGGSEVVVVPDLMTITPVTSDTNPAIGLCFPLSIPAGSRISARCQCNSVTAAERLLEVVLHGVG